MFRLGLVCDNTPILLLKQGYNNVDTVSFSICHFYLSDQASLYTLLGRSLTPYIQKYPPHNIGDQKYVHCSRKCSHYLSKVLPLKYFF